MPKIYDKAAIAPQIIDLMQNGMSLNQACKGKDMPDPSTFLKWTYEDEKLSQQYARAREIRADRLADEILEIADDAYNDTIETEQGLMPNRAAIERAKIRIDARKWSAGKMAPKKYGDKVTQEHTGEGGGAITINIKDMS